MNINIKRKKLVSPAVMWAIVLAGILFSFGLIRNERIFPTSWITQFFFILAFIHWADYFFGALMVHREASYGVNRITKIIKQGVYSKVRHPIYSATIILAWGLFFYFPYARVLGSVLWLTIVLFYWMRLEEKYLIEKFGSGYRDYMKDVPMFIPRIFKR